ncbi:MAG: hypothetical protein LKG17_03580 [Megasphaera sp.]|jgi:hypothetical protein|nr:hypothetical protein [Megasphaera sp.]
MKNKKYEVIDDSFKIPEEYKKMTVKELDELIKQEEIRLGKRKSKND